MTIESLREALRQDSYLRNYNIEVQNGGKEVTLRGEVKSFHHKQIANHVALTHINGDAGRLKLINDLDVVYPKK
tara:strand:+ start:1426 stop:1647 length:222 start_codon:yes stop_codon:yes gene_type:complete